MNWVHLPQASIPAKEGRWGRSEDFLMRSPFIGGPMAKNNCENRYLDNFKRRFYLRCFQVSASLICQHFFLSPGIFLQTLYKYRCRYWHSYKCNYRLLSGDMYRADGDPSVGESSGEVQLGPRANWGALALWRQLKFQGQSWLSIPELEVAEPGHNSGLLVPEKELGLNQTKYSHCCVIVDKQSFKKTDLSWSA